MLARKMKKERNNAGKQDIANPKEHRCKISRDVLETWLLSSRAKEHLLQEIRFWERLFYLSDNCKKVFVL